MDDLISRQAAIDVFYEFWGTSLTRTVDAINQLPHAQPKQHIDTDGTLWITVSDIEQVKRVIVDEEKSKFCKQFYQDAQPERPKGAWLGVDSYSAFGGDLETWMAHGNPIAYYYCSNCKEQARTDEEGNDILSNFCPECGADMRGSME